MAQIYIEGLGNVNIQGNVPTPEEEKAIVSITTKNSRHRTTNKY